MSKNALPIGRRRTRCRSDVEERVADRTSKNALPIGRRRTRCRSDVEERVADRTLKNALPIGRRRTRCRSDVEERVADRTSKNALPKNVQPELTRTFQPDLRASVFCEILAHYILHCVILEREKNAA